MDAVDCPPTDCVEWPKGRDRDGYGRIGKSGAAHRVVWERAFVPIPPGMVIDHLCFNRACVNLAHLRVTDRVTNCERQRSALKTHCKNGHEFTVENTYIRTAPSEGRRTCRACNSAAQARRTERRRASAAIAEATS